MKTCSPCLGLFRPVDLKSCPVVIFFWISLAIAVVGAVDHRRANGPPWSIRPKLSSDQQWPLFVDSPPSILHSKEREARLAALDEADTGSNASSPYAALLNALHIMESHFFSVSHGTWPNAIDWTAAVMGTQVSASLSAMSEYSSQEKLFTLHAFSHENIINRYFSQITTFYFGENAFSLRTQAYDDMLWVVLGWIESIKFIKKHSRLHYAHDSSLKGSGSWTLRWYAQQFIPQFAHRARLFYDLASKGWDTTLCGGGMVWNPHLAPYKNAITNQLFIAASVSMYLYFPGDDNTSPFARPTAATESNYNSRIMWENTPPAKAHDNQYLQNAVKAYKWLKNSGMRNTAGLYTDGFHIRGWRGGRHGSNGTEQCDIRDETVYTYNQGVILSGLRGLWEATGDIAYLEDGHELVHDVIKATGWDNRDTEWKYQWAGMGRNGVMEEICDWSGFCSQDGQTFKGIFWHHFTIFCSPLPTNSDDDGENKNETLDRPWLGDEETRTLHKQSCEKYDAWIKANARAAWVTRDDNGEFGQWWGRPWPGRRQNLDDDDNDHGNDKINADTKLKAPPKSDGEVDYRNEGVPVDDIWRLSLAGDPDDFLHPNIATPLTVEDSDDKKSRTRDLNDRGRGRTVETQSGGVAVIRALWKLVDSKREQKGQG